MNHVSASDLLARAGFRMQEIAMADDRVTAVTVTLKKLEPPVAAEIDHVSVRSVRNRT